MSVRQASHRQANTGLASVNSKVKYSVSKAIGRKQYAEVIEPRKLKMGLDDVVDLTEIKTGNGIMQVIFCTPRSKSMAC